MIVSSAPFPGGRCCSAPVVPAAALAAVSFGFGVAAWIVLLDSGRDTLHSAPLRIYDREGVWVATLHAGAGLSEENLLHDIRTALAAGGETSR